MKNKKVVVVYVEGRLADWLEAKAIEGYKKTAFVRNVLAERMAREGV